MSQPEPAVASARPYPPIQAAEPNRRYASMLLQDIASSRGEMTAVYQYLYQHWILETAESELAHLLARIAKVEMQHLDILGKLVVLLGGNPICRTNPCSCSTAWNGNMLQYTGSRRQLLAHNMSLELAAVNDYRTQAELIRDPCVSAILIRLAEDEEIHYQLFRSLLGAGK